MGYKHRALDHGKILASLSAPNFLLKIIPHVDGTARICELVRYFCEDITVKGAWEGPAGLELFHHAPRAGCVAAGARSDLGCAYHDRPDARAGHCGPRLSRRVMAVSRIGPWVLYRPPAGCIVYGWNGSSLACGRDGPVPRESRAR
ncbi:acetoacetate decarboxylase family protein [Cupriavidus basilensis]